MLVVEPLSAEWRAPFEAVCGREYDGQFWHLLVQNLEWMKALFLTKTSSNDMYVVGIGNCVRLTCAVKRIYKRLGTST